MPSDPNGAGPLLELSGIGKSFGAVRALDGMDLAIGRAEVVGLMGDNGAGKSTLTKIIAGNFPPTEGDIRLEGNLEYRQDLVSYLKGALFVDAGNIWLVNADASRATVPFIQPSPA